MDNDGKFVDGDVSARVRDGGKGSRVVWLKTDGGVEGDTWGRGDVKRRSSGGRSGAIIKRTGSQAKEERRRGGRRDGDVSSADGVTTEQGNGRGQSGVAERTVEEGEERGHEMGGRELNRNIIVNVGDLVLGVIITRRCRCRGGQGKAGQARQGQSRRQERDQDRSRRKRSPHLFSNVFLPLQPPSPSPHRPRPSLSPPIPPSPQVSKDQILFL